MSRPERGFESVPDKLPAYATHLTLHTNQIEKIAADSFKLDKLETLDLTSNKISSIHRKSFNVLHRLEVLILRGNKLASIPGKLFAELKKLKCLILSQNSLTHLSPTTFNGLRWLDELNLDYNEISTLPDGLFQDLTQLRVVSLQQNKLSCFPHAALKPLVKIQEIILGGNNFQKKCTSVDLKQFTALKKLALVRCGIQDSMLKNFRFGRDTRTLLHLDLSENNLMSPDARLFVNVTELHLHTNYISADALTNVFHNLPHSKVNSLSLNSQLNSSDGSRSTWQITNTTFQGLQLTIVEELDISGNSIPQLPQGSFQWLQHLKTLIIANCDLSFLPRGLFQGFHSLTNLTLSHNKLSNIRQVSESIANLLHLHHLNLNENKFFGEIPPEIFTGIPSLEELDLSNNSFVSIHPHSFKLLPNLKILDLSYNHLVQLPHAVFSFLTSLKVLYLRDNLLNIHGHTGEHPLHGLKYLKKLSISFYHSAMAYLPDVPSLEHLHITGQKFSHTTVKVPITVSTLQKANLSRLQTIQIEEARIIAATFPKGSHYPFDKADFLDELHVHTPWIQVTTLKLHDSVWLDDMRALMSFLNLFPNLEELSLNNLDTLHDMDVLPNKLMNLQRLDMSSNQIKEINTDLLQSLPRLMYLNITSNPLSDSCHGCKIKTFIKWLQTDRRIQLEKLPPCLRPKERGKVFMYSLEFCAFSHIILHSVTGCLVLVVVVTISTALGIKFRWHIHYLFFKLKLRCGGYQVKVHRNVQPQHKRYDAFVVYNEHDRDWIMQELVPNLEGTELPNFKLCIHERDFMPGNDIFENILDSIENSHKTLLVLSPHSAQSEWCYFEMRMAQSRLFEDKEDVLLMVMLREIPDNVMPRVLRKILMIKRYLKWPNNDLGRKMFWQKLKVALQTESRVNRVANV
ncbi:toll-like receptor 13 [Ptychodera flava]|uniref:toll-like receptor 13 n=1 Tax=Ptychodera flava TaxID=63121 RepID=UPI00396A4DA1